MWIEELQRISRASQNAIDELNAFQIRLRDKATHQDQVLLALWARNLGPGAVGPAVSDAMAYAIARQDEMFTRLRNADMFHLMISVYAVGDFANYLRDVHNIVPTPDVETHPFIKAIQALSAQKTRIAEVYSVDYDASDAAILAELTRNNPWR